jgi:DNA-binding transcriptional MocR family regulator
MMLHLQIDKNRKGELPLYKQISEQIIRKIEEGFLPKGSRLPTVRELADELAVTRVTAHSAYTRLQSEGWIEATVGRGTFVTGAPSSSEPAELAITPNRVMADMSRLGHHPGIRSLAMAEADPHLYPAREFMRLIQSLEKNATELFRYGSSQGDALLRQELSGLVEERGIRAKPDDILVTTGITQGLALVTAALCERGDKVLVEQPTYLGFLGLAESCGVDPIGVPLDDEGPRLDYMQRVLARERPRFFYTIPSFQNPTGISQSAKRRADLLALAREYGLTILEDDIYNRLGYEGPSPRALKADDRDDLVIYFDGFSKSLLPGLRIGFVILPPALKENVLSLLQVREICGPPLMHRALGEFLRRGSYRDHLRRVLPVYRKRRDALLDSLEETMPEEVEWTTPDGGYCSWVTLPREGHFDELYRMALDRGVAYTPGEVFLAEPESRHHMRLCFGARDEKVIREAVSILSETIADLMEHRPAAPSRSQDLKPIV